MSKLLRWLVSAALLAAIAWQIDWALVVQALAGMRPDYGLAAAAVLVLAQLAAARRWQVLARPLGFSRPLPQFIGFYFIGMYFNLVLPTSVGGDVVRAWYLDGRSGRRAAAFASVFLDRLNGVLVLLAVAALGSLLSPQPLPAWVHTSVWGAVVSAVVGLAILPLLVQHGWAPGKLRRLLQALGEPAIRQPRVLLETTVLSVVVQSASVLIVWLIGQAIAAPVPAAYYWVLVPMVSLLTLLPSIGGAGVREGAMVVFLAPLGVGPETALTLSFLWFAVAASVSLVGGVVYLFGRFPSPVEATGATPEAQPIMDLSIIIPVKDERENVQPLHDRLREVLDPLGLSYEVIFVDDGSGDGTFGMLKQLAAAHARVKVVQFRRNFGQSAALQAGIDWSQGNVLVTMDGDLQNDPADIPRLLDKLGEGYDAVLGLRARRQDQFFMRTLPSLAGNWLIRKVTGAWTRDLGCTLRAIRRDLAEELPLYGEMHRFLPVLAQQAGARLAQIPVRHHPRTNGRTKYNLTRTFRVLLDLITVKFLHSYLTRPMHVMGLAGLVSMALGVVSLVATVWMKSQFRVFMTGNPLLLLSAMLELVGVQLISIGLIGEVLTRTYFESQGKRAYRVRTTLNLAPPLQRQVA